MVDLKPYIKRFRDKKVWDAFVLEAFQWFRTNATENNNHYPELDKEIMETAKSVAKTIPLRAVIRKDITDDHPMTTITGKSGYSCIFYSKFSSKNFGE